IEALKAGYEAEFVTDAVGSRSDIAHRTGIRRMSLAGAVPNTTLAVVMEWFRAWTGPLAEPARRTTGWYLTEVPGVTDTVGVSNGEAALAQAALAGEGSCAREPASSAGVLDGGVRFSRRDGVLRRAQSALRAVP